MTYHKDSNLFIEHVHKQLREQGFDNKEKVKKEFWFHCLNILINQFNNIDKKIEMPTEPIDLNLKIDDPFYPIYNLLITGEINV